MDDIFEKYYKEYRDDLQGISLFHANDRKGFEEAVKYAQYRLCRNYKIESTTCPKCNSTHTWSSNYKSQYGCDDCGIIWGEDKDK